MSLIALGSDGALRLGVSYALDQVENSLALRPIFTVVRQDLIQKAQLPSRCVPNLRIVQGAQNMVIADMLFRDYRTDRFVSQGLVCLTAGLLHAIPAALASWLLLRRGFSVNSVAAGLVMGTLAGLAGVTMLELHCANLQAPHVMLWHTAVMPVSAAAGALLAWLLRLRASSGPHERSPVE